MAKTANYQRIEDKLKRGEVVILDGGISSEMQNAGYPQDLNLGELWGVRGLYTDFGIEASREVHRRYVKAGAELLMTNTFRLDMCPTAELDGRCPGEPGTWRKLVKFSVDIVREEAAKLGREQETAVAFVQARPALCDPQWLKELAGLLKEAQPDLLLMEAISDIPEDLSFPEYETLLETGIPLWVSYRRVVGGICGLYGEVRKMDGDLFQRAAAKFEQMGIGAVLVNCLPAVSVYGVLPWLRQATALPLGAYANTGRFVNPGWDFSMADTPEEYAAHARVWVQEGAQIVGGCCGTMPAHIAAVAEALKVPASV
ncbi:MAG: homocysteine S-methyltransferase family protein [Chloroflexi bacterium]|nr:homocysteine S-methyltransferase family protein [Chloroflexota bacterium]